MTTTSSRRARPGRIALVVVIVAALVAGVTIFAEWAGGADGSTATDPGRVPVVQTPSGTASTADGGAVAWPAAGEAAVSVGDGPIDASSAHALPMASVSKLVTALMVLEQRPGKIRRIEG